MPAPSSTILLRKTALSFLAAITLAATLTAGLWPFRFHPPNEVKWLPGQPGLWFGDYGTAFSDGEFTPPMVVSGSGASVEFWIKPAVSEDSATLLAFYTPANPQQFHIQQSLDDLFILRDIPAGRGKWKTSYVSVDSVFRKDKPMHVLISSGAGGTRVYLNGPLVRVAPSLHIQPSDFSGRLVVANSPLGNHTWGGLMRGLAFYAREISPDEAAAHFREDASPGWIGNSEVHDAVVFYAFAEGTGRQIANSAPTGQPGLFLPADYRILHQAFLTPFWKEFRPNQSYVEDLVLNIAGFVPLGVAACAILVYLVPVSRPVLWSTLFALAVSLTIEVLQGFIPTRLSGTTDLITNTLGGFLGARLMLASPVQAFARHLGFQKLAPAASGFSAADPSANDRSAN
jgi:VanZ family protein